MKSAEEAASLMGAWVTLAGYQGRVTGVTYHSGLNDRGELVDFPSTSVTVEVWGHTKKGYEEKQNEAQAPNLQSGAQSVDDNSEERRGNRYDDQHGGGFPPESPAHREGAELGQRRRPRHGAGGEGAGKTNPLTALNWLRQSMWPNGPKYEKGPKGRMEQTGEKS